MNRLKVGDWVEAAALSPDGGSFLPWDSQEAANAEPDDRQLFMIVKKADDQSATLVGILAESRTLVDCEVSQEGWDSPIIDGSFRRVLDTSKIPADYIARVRACYGLE